MQISLRKSNALQASINDAIKSIEITPNVVINEFQNPDAVITHAVNTLTTNIERRTKLNSALYEIRNAVGKVNVTAGIADRLTSIAYTEKTIQLYSALANAQTRTKLEEIVGKLTKIQQTDASQVRYGYADSTVTTGILTEEQINSFRSAIANAKKEKQKLQDQVLELNIQTKIDLSEATIATLTAENLL